MAANDVSETLLERRTINSHDATQFTSSNQTPFESSSDGENPSRLLNDPASSSDEGELCPLPSNQEKDTSVPAPPPVPSSGMSIRAHKLWIGNLDKRLTEQNILKFMSPFGKITSFKYLLHTTGAEKGEPRGYCFVEYSTREEAERAKTVLQGKLALGRKLLVDWARPDLHVAGKKVGGQVSETWDASSVSATLQEGTSTSAKIAAIEAKLRQMEDESQGKTKGRNSPEVIGQVYTQGSIGKKGHRLKMYRSSKPYSSRIGIRPRRV